MALWDPRWRPLVVIIGLLAFIVTASLVFFAFDYYGPELCRAWSVLC